VKTTIKKNRFFYSVITLLVIFLGITSRKINFVPLFIGDILYAVMIYFGFRAVFFFKPKITFILSLLFCFFIETSQLIQWEWLIAIRKTILGHYVLGEGFLWTDLICYLFGSTLAVFTDHNFIKER